MNGKIHVVVNVSVLFFLCFFQIRKQQKEHAELIEEYRVKQQQQGSMQPAMIHGMPPMQPHAGMMPVGPPINQPMMGPMMPIRLHPGQPDATNVTNTAGWHPGAPVPSGAPQMPGVMPAQVVQAQPTQPAVARPVRGSQVASLLMWISTIPTHLVKAFRSVSARSGYGSSRRGKECNLWRRWKDSGWNTAWSNSKSLTAKMVQSGPYHKCLFTTRSYRRTSCSHPECSSRCKATISTAARHATRVHWRTVQTNDG